MIICIINEMKSKIKMDVIMMYIDRILVHWYPHFFSFQRLYPITSMINPIRKFIMGINPAINARYPKNRKRTQLINSRTTPYVTNVGRSTTTFTTSITLVSSSIRYLLVTSL